LQGHAAIVIGVRSPDNSHDLEPGRRAKPEGYAPESSTEPDQPAEKMPAAKNPLLAMAPAAFTMKNQGRWRIRTCLATGCASQILDVTIPSVR
jgi:hypothetical protein